MSKKFTTPTSLRLDDDLKLEVTALAKKGDRTLSNQLVRLIRLGILFEKMYKDIGN